MTSQSRLLVIEVQMERENAMTEVDEASKNKAQSSIELPLDTFKENRNTDSCSRDDICSTSVTKSLNISTENIEDKNTDSSNEEREDAQMQMDQSWGIPVENPAKKLKKDNEFPQETFESENTDSSSKETRANSEISLEKAIDNSSRTSEEKPDSSTQKLRHSNNVDIENILNSLPISKLKVEHESADSSSGENRKVGGTSSVSSCEKSRGNSTEKGLRDSIIGKSSILVGGVKITEKLTNVSAEKEACTPCSATPCSTMIQKYSNAYIDCYCVPKSSVSSQTSVMELPETTLLKIFSLLSEEQVCNVACVCHEWKRVAYDSSLWKSVDLRRFHTALEERSLARLICARMTPLLFKINLGGLSLTSRVFKLLANECPKLKVLSLESVTFLKKFASSGKTFPLGLETLDLRHSSGDSSAFTAIAKAIDGIESLGVSDQFLTSLLSSNDLEEMFPKLAKSKVLEFSYCTTLTDTMMGYVATHCPLLESLCLRRCNTFHGASLPVLLTSCPLLTSLVLDGTAVTDGSLRAADWTNSSITELDLSWCRHLSHEGLKSILYRLTNLRYLRLCCVGYGHGVTDDVLEQMAEAKYENLQILDASYSSLLTDEGLSQFIHVCQGLLYLRINHCRSTTPRLMDLLPADSQVFVVANFPIDSEVPFNHELLRYTYWPTPIFMRNFGLDIQMGWN